MSERFTPAARPTKSFSRMTRSCGGSLMGWRIRKNIISEMKTSRLEGKVGLFVFIGLVLLAALLLQFSKGTTFFRPTIQILLRAGNVGGLKMRAQVLMAGVQVGTVSDIRLGPQGTNVTITLKIYSQYTVHKDARFLIEQSGFLGDQYVAIMPTRNQGDVFRDGDTAEAE